MEVAMTTGAISRVKLQSNLHHQQTNTQFFTGRLPFLSPKQQCQSTEGKNINPMDLRTPSSPGGHPALSLTTNSSWLPWGGLPCLSSALRQALALPQNAVLHLIAWFFLFKNVKASFGANFASFFRKQVPVFVLFMHCTVGGRLITSSCFFLHRPLQKSVLNSIWPAILTCSWTSPTARQPVYYALHLFHGIITSCGAVSGTRSL